MTSTNNNNNTNTKLSLWRNFIRTIKTIITPIRETFQKFSKKFPNTAQNIQLTFVFIFAILDLFSSILNYLLSLGFLPETLRPFLPRIHEILVSPFLQIWASPEKVFFFSYMVIEFMVVRSVFKFSKLVRYNILLIFSLLMLQGLIISYWDLLCHREISMDTARWAYEQTILFSDKYLAFSLFYTTFIVFLILYFYLYVVALTGKFATFPGMDWITDSVCFWLKIKTPTMRFGKRKKDDKRK
jgi:hypothetical protein